jgi:hypothetical protein
MLLPASQNRCKAPGPGHTVVTLPPFSTVGPFFCICPRVSSRVLWHGRVAEGAERSEFRGLSRTVLNVR